MKKFLIVLFLPVLIIMTSCKGDKNKEQEATTTKEEKTDNSTTSNNTNPMDGTKSARYEQRKAKGDTMAMAYKSLQAYLPDVNGYTKNEGPKRQPVQRSRYG